MKSKKVVTNSDCFCSATMLTSKIIFKKKTILNLLRARIAATNLFQSILQDRISLNYTRIKNAHEVRKKIIVFLFIFCSA